MMRHMTHIFFVVQLYWTFKVSAVAHDTVWPHQKCKRALGLRPEVNLLLGTPKWFLSIHKVVLQMVQLENL